MAVSTRPLLAESVRWWARRPLVLRLGACVAHAALIWGVSAQGGRQLLGSPQPWKPWVQNSAHVVVYGVLGALVFCCRGGPSTEPGAARATDADTRPLRGGVAAFVLTVLYGVVDEWHQSMVPGRTPDAWDVVSDAGGALLGIAFVVWAHAGGRAARLPLLQGLALAALGVPMASLS